MTIPTVQVAVSLVDPGGKPISGAQVTALLSAPIVYEGVVVPSRDAAVTDDLGQCTLTLVPTEIVSEDVTYQIVIWAPYETQAAIFDGVSVPNVASITLVELLGGTAGGSTLTYWNGTAYWTGSLYWG